MRKNRNLAIIALSLSMIIVNAIPRAFCGQYGDVDRSFHEQIYFIKQYRMFRDHRDILKEVEIKPGSAVQASSNVPEKIIYRQVREGEKDLREDAGKNFEKIVRRASEMHNVPDAVIKAIIHVESGFNPGAISPKGAQGLMQLMPGTASMINVKNPFDPEQNIAGGAGLIRRYLDEYGSIKKSLIAYNAGPAYVNRGGIIPAETRNYIKNVFRYYKYYENNR